MIIKRTKLNKNITRNIKRLGPNYIEKAKKYGIYIVLEKTLSSNKFNKQIKIYSLELQIVNKKQNKFDLVRFGYIYETTRKAIINYHKETFLRELGNIQRYFLETQFIIDKDNQTISLGLTHTQNLVEQFKPKPFMNELGLKFIEYLYLTEYPKNYQSNAYLNLLETKTLKEVWKRHNTIGYSYTSPKNWKLNAPIYMEFVYIQKCLTVILELWKGKSFKSWWRANEKGEEIFIGKEYKPN